MAPDAVFSSEYMLESDEGSPLPMLDFGNDSDTLAFHDMSKDAAAKAPYPTPTYAPLAVPNNFVSPQSLPEARDSLSASSSSSSSKRTGRSFSAKSTMTTDDVTMSDGLEQKDAWKMSDFINDDEDDGPASQGGDGTIDPSSIDNPFQFGAPSSNHNRDATTVSNTPGPFDMDANRFTPEASLSPNGEGQSPSFSSPGGPDTAHDHMKAGTKQYSLTKSMKDLKTNGSRETSPWKDVSGLPDMSSTRHYPSQATSFSSPSPNTNLDFGFSAGTGQNAHQGWLSNFNLNPSSIPQNGMNGVAFQMQPEAHGLPAFNFHPQQQEQQQQQQQQQQPQQQAIPGRYQLKVDGGAAKSRVETQIRIKLILYPLPPGIRRLHLPTHTISKPKLLARPTPPRSPDMLELHTALVCTSAMQNESLKMKALQRAKASAMSMKLDPLPEPGSQNEENEGQNGAEIHICSGCMARERKRAARKKIKKPEDEKLWLKDEDRRIVVFNSQEVRDFSPRQEGDGFSVDVQMRIACYCRHHAEKLGFQVIFTVTDCRGRFVAQAMSSSIMITDDHKTHGQASSAMANSPDNTTLMLASNLAPDTKSLSPPPTFPYGMPQSTSDIQLLPNNVPFPLPALAPTAAPQSAPVAPVNRMLSRPASPSSLSGPSAKKRKASSSAMKVPTGLSMTRIDTDQLGASPSHQQVSAPASSTAAATSPFSPQSFAPGPDPLFGQNMLGGPMAQPFATGPTTPNGSEQVMFGNSHRPTSFDNTPMGNTPQMYSAPASSHPSRAPSPGTLRNGNANGMQQQSSQFAQAVASSLYSAIPMGMNAAPSPPSVIHKIIPAEGPKSGGIEVTILGSGFHQGLEVMFGDVRATTTTYWGESSLVCLLPPAPHATTVLVSFKHQSSPAAQQFSAKQQPIFKYMDDDEQQLMRTALTVLGHKMNGKVEDIGDIARRIIGDMNSNWGQSSSGAGGQHGGGPQFNGYSFDTQQLETQLLKVLELIDLDDSPHKPRLNLRRSTGQTMLHLACSLGLHRFVAGLLARNANPDMRDKGGYTPLHMAALNDHSEIVRRLITAGADPTIRTLSGLTAADVAQSREVVRAIKRVERHARSRSGGSLTSRTSSLTSLKSLWEPPSSTRPAAADQTTSEESDTGEESPEYSGEESPEYSSENPVSSDDPDADEGPWLQSRRPSTHVASRRTSLDATLQAPRHGIAGGLHSPAAAVTAFKDQFATQFHQFQQAMALHIQNLTQLPYLPQMPTIPTMSPLADYQAYLNSAAVLQRLSSMVPNIGGSRPGSAGDQPLGDGKWWDSLTAAPAPPPPAYDEIYPHGDMDTKQSSAAQAAAEAEADEKCAARYDMPTESAVASGSSAAAATQQHKLPALLQIGRKNAITKEQQENLQRARAEKLKRVSRDRNLFFFWIPLLLIVLCAMLYSRFPGLFYGVWNFAYQVAASRVASVAPEFGQTRAVEVQ
ncbi:Ankyrin repeat protein [Coniochaeta hoffmannii]|uniref:Ankyrin repeat protein n=1 Tax=Coniochaeta hoffmannii TaxID=91930 RepID=A0AA38R4X1_9PEZI|nr:Ankyrin repeat protein [Coniochaeta hoffmannii]